MTIDMAAERLECDALIVGSGAGALCAALTACHAGLDVLVLEKEPWFGGASARSGGGLWIPGNKLGAAAGIADSREEMMTYFRHEAGPLFDEARVTAFLDNGPRMLDFVTANSPVRFVLLQGVSDYHPHHPGGKSEGRAIMAASLSAKLLGREIKRLRRPMKVSTFMGMQIGIEDFRYFYTAGRNLKSFLHVTRMVLRSMIERIVHGQPMRLASGNALVGGLAASCFGSGVRIMTSAPVRALRTTGDAVTGAVAEIDGRMVDIMARKGVLLATGGFPHDSERRARLFPSGARNPEVWSLMPYGNSGDGLRMGEAVGAHVEEAMRCAVALSPMSRVDTDEGEMRSFPVFSTRGNPGKLAVKRNGRRFVDEASSYHDFSVGLLAASQGEPDAIAYVISDHRSIRRYGLGFAHPYPMPLGPHLRSGYVIRGETIGELAEKAGIDAEALTQTVETFNANARTGIDPDFGRGSNAYDRWAGDPAHKPNPCLGPLEQGPYYAVRVFAGAVGTFAGLMTNANAQVLRRDGSVIPGLYAAGNDLASITGGDYIGGGCTIGPAMTFGYIAGKHMGGQP